MLSAHSCFVTRSNTTPLTTNTPSSIHAAGQRDGSPGAYRKLPIANNDDQITIQPAIQPVNAAPMRFSCATSPSLMPAAARMSVHPGPAGFTFCTNEISVARSVVGPMNAVSSHATVVMPTCTIVTVAKPTPGMRYGTATAVISDAAIATISHQADTRHQNQRAM